MVSARRGYPGPETSAARGTGCASDTSCPARSTPRPSCWRRRARAEEAGFEALWISDHFHPWNDAQGQSPFVWSMIGALSQVCRAAGDHRGHLPDRPHPPGDHRAGRRDQRGAARGPLRARRRHRRGAQRAHLRRPLAARRRPAGDARGGGRAHPRSCGRAGVVNHRGAHYTVENARIYTLPETPPPIYVSGVRAEGHRAGRRIGDGYISTTPDPELVDAFRGAAARASPPRPGLRSPAPTTEEEGTDRAPDLAERRRCPASCRRCCRRRSTSSRPSSLRPPEDMKEIRLRQRPGTHLGRSRRSAKAGYDEVYVGNTGPHYGACSRPLRRPCPARRS